MQAASFMRADATWLRLSKSSRCMHARIPRFSTVVSDAFLAFTASMPCRMSPSRYRRIFWGDGQNEETITVVPEDIRFIGGLQAVHRLTGEQVRARVNIFAPPRTQLRPQHRWPKSPIGLLASPGQARRGRPPILMPRSCFRRNASHAPEKPRHYYHYFHDYHAQYHAHDSH